MSHSTKPRRHISSPRSVGIHVQFRARHHTILSSLLQSSRLLCISPSLVSRRRPRIIPSGLASTVEHLRFFASTLQSSSVFDDIPSFHLFVDTSVVPELSLTRCPERPRVGPSFVRASTCHSCSADDTLSFFSFIICSWKPSRELLQTQRISKQLYQSE
jgi:hypothetical protein